MTMKQHRSSRLADQCRVTVNPDDYNASHAAIMEYNERVKMIDRLGWADHTSDWDLGTTIVLDESNGQSVTTTQGDPFLEWGIKLDCLDLLDYISKVQTHVSIVIYGTDIEAKVYTDLGLSVTAPMNTDEYDSSHSDEYDFRRILGKVGPRQGRRDVLPFSGIFSGDRFVGGERLAFHNNRHGNLL